MPWVQRKAPVGGLGSQGLIPLLLLQRGRRGGLGLGGVVLGPGGGHVELLRGLDGSKEGSQEGPRAASSLGCTRREKEGVQVCKKPAIPRDDQIFSLVEGTMRAWLRCFLSKAMALWV